MMEKDFNTLFDRVISFTIKKHDSNSHSYNSSITKNLRLLLKLQNQTGLTKEVLLQITDEQDPLILFSSIISEMDYLDLKKEQRLEMDFGSFPHHICNLIKSCLDEQMKSSPKFILVLRVSSESKFLNQHLTTYDEKVYLEIIEVNVICQLSISLMPASLQKKLSYLASCMKNLKTDLNSEKLKSSQEKNFLEEEVQSLKESLQHQVSAMESLKKEFNQKMSSESDKYALLMSEEREKHLQIQSEIDRKYAREKRKLECDHKGQLEDSMTKNTSLIKKNKELVIAKEKLDKSLRVCEQKYRDCKDELTQHKEELKNLQKIRTKYEEQDEKHVSIIRELVDQRDNLIKELENKEISLKNLKHEFGVVQHQKSSVEKEYVVVMEKIKRRNDSCQRLFTDLKEERDLNKKLHLEIEEGKLKSEQNSSALSELKKLLDVKESELKEAQDIAAKLPSKDFEIKDLIDKLQEANAKILEYEKAIEIKDRNASWMNKRLNELEYGGTLMKKAPLAEAYVTHQNHRTPFHQKLIGYDSAPSLTTSTPFSASSGPFNVGFKGNFRNMSDIRSVQGIPEIIEETSLPRTDQESNKENDKGLPEKYFEPVKKSKSFPVQGLLRKNAIPKTTDQTGVKKDSKISGTRANAATAFPRGRGHQKVTATKSSYFNT